MTIEDDFIQHYQKIACLIGFDSLIARIIAILYIEPNEIPMEELAKKTGYSLASISNKIKILESTGIIKRIKKPKTKKVFLYAEKDLQQIMKEHLIRKQEFLINTAKEDIPKIIEKHKKIKDETEKKKLQNLEKYYKGILQFDKIITKLLKEIDSEQ